MSIAALIDHTLLAPDVTAQHIRTCAARPSIIVSPLFVSAQPG
ncbi:deoxyribose-phosphate aldolase [Cutibacterium acnes JCM 18916]|nr:deoxyribose-phosphate aldolase [Cutibacterium acnes JCM 18916]